MGSVEFDLGFTDSSNLTLSVIEIDTTTPPTSLFFGASADSSGSDPLTSIDNASPWHSSVVDGAAIPLAPSGDGAYMRITVRAGNFFSGIHTLSIVNNANRFTTDPTGASNTDGHGQRP